ncbi:DNA recombination and repair protein RecO [Salmonella enterica subsp. enterica serovar Madelia]|nr:DNA recombination and repair protein RecO [Salmonella enterica subsp. enterica serovar Madelia]
MKRASPNSFFDYLNCIQALAGTTGSPEPALRRFELALLGHLGYGVNFTHCAGSGERVDDTMTYRYREEKGFFASVVIDNNTFTGTAPESAGCAGIPGCRYLACR